MACLLRPQSAGAPLALVSRCRMHACNRPHFSDFSSASVESPTDARVHSGHNKGESMLLKIGRRFEVEISASSLFVRVGGFERYWNRQGLPTH